MGAAFLTPDCMVVRSLIQTPVRDIGLSSFSRSHIR
jgi:hypothetical protein